MNWKEMVVAIAGLLFLFCLIATAATYDKELKLAKMKVCACY